jgi:hypothetical protein
VRTIIVLIALCLSACVNEHKAHCDGMFERTLRDIAAQSDQGYVDIVIMKKDCPEYLQ